MEEWKEGGQNNIPLFRFPACSPRPRPRPGAPAGPSTLAPLPPSPAASLTERVEPGQAAVTLPARHSGLAKTGARVIALETQGACGRKGAGQQGDRPRAPGSLGARAVAPTHLPGGSRRAGRVSPGPSGRSPPDSAGSVARPCGLGSGGSARRGRCSGRAPGRTCTAQSGRCSCKLWAGGRWGRVSAAPASGGRGGRASPPPCAEWAGSPRKVTGGSQAQLDQGYGDRLIDLPKQDALRSRGSTIHGHPDTQDPPR